MSYDFLGSASTFEIVPDNLEEFFRFPTSIIEKYRFSDTLMEYDIERYNLSLDMGTCAREHIVEKGRHFFKDTQKALFLNYEDIPIGLLGFSTYKYGLGDFVIHQIQATKQKPVLEFQNTEISNGRHMLLDVETHNNFLKGFDWRCVLVNSLEFYLLSKLSDSKSQIKLYLHSKWFDDNRYLNTVKKLGFELNPDESNAMWKKTINKNNLSMNS